MNNDHSWSNPLSSHVFDVWLRRVGRGDVIASLVEVATEVHIMCQVSVEGDILATHYTTTYICHAYIRLQYSNNRLRYSNIAIKNELN